MRQPHLSQILIPTNNCPAPQRQRRKQGERAKHSLEHALPRLVHFRVPFAGAILGGTGRGDNGGIDNATFRKDEAIFLQILVHLFEQHLAKDLTSPD